MNIHFNLKKKRDDYKKIKYSGWLWLVFYLIIIKYTEK